MPGSSGSARRRPKGIAIRPEAVRQARQEMGLSLTDLAGGQVTRAAMHLVETGRMRPSMRTLQLIAQRTGRPISYFMSEPQGSDEQRSARDELVQLVDGDELPAAVALGQELLAEDLEPGLEAEVRFAIGRAMVRMADGEHALPHLALARRLFESIGDSWMSAHVHVQEGMAMFLVEDPRTLPRAMDALERCERLEPPDPALHATVLNLLGNACMRANDWRSAARFFDMGLRACEDVVSLRQAARLHDGLSAAMQRLGDFGAALRSAERASALYAADSDTLSMIRAENNLGYVLLRQGELAAAATHLYRALELCDEHGVQRLGRAVVLNSIGELELARGDARAAETFLRQSVDVAIDMHERYAEASARHLLARAHLLLGDEAAADASFAAAVDLLQQLQLPERLRECAADYADLLHRRGLLEDSIAYWRIAAAAAGRIATAEQVGEVLLRQTGA